MYNARAHVTAQATQFFRRLEMSTTTYRMALVSTDMELYPGLKPRENPIILTRSSGGTPEQRAQNFGNLISQIINLKTSGINQGFESVLFALNGPFRPEANVPLVIVYISDSDDSKDSTGSIVKKPLDYYANAYLSLVGNNPDLLRVYSINYVPGGARCATRFHADMDMPGFEDRYFGLAALLGGETADLCSPFASTIDLTGLRLTELPRRFRLEGKADPASIQITFSLNGQQVSGPSFIFDPSTNEIIFDVAPPEGVTIQVTYSPIA